MFLTIIIFLILLSVLVFVHEVGHFWTARKFGVKAEEFGFGFPPRIGGFYRDEDGRWRYIRGNREIKGIKNTVFSINWIPLGGFVKIKGEDGEAKEDADSFTSHPIWQRFIILSAGVSMNVILAAFLISIGLMVGLPQVLGDLGPQAEVTDKKIQIARVMPGSPAESAGLKMADAILSINDNKFASDQELQDFVGERANQELNYKIRRGQEEMILKITPEIREETGRGGVGIAIITTGLVKYPWHVAIWEGLKTTIFLVWIIIIAFYELFKGLLMGQGVGVDIAGPVGIAALTGQMAEMGFIYLLQFTALLSINLAIINFLPFPALDGGRVIFLAIEKIKGSPVKRETEAVIHNMGFILLMILILVVTFKDIARWVS